MTRRAGLPGECGLPRLLEEGTEVQLRRTNELRHDAEELDELLCALEHRAREFRASWLS